MRGCQLEEEAVQVERRYSVSFETDEDGVYIATVPSLPGVVEQGDTKEETVERLQKSVDSFSHHDD